MSPKTAVDLIKLDLASLTSVGRCADDLASFGEKLDVIIGSVGTMAVPFSFSPDGYELHFATNYLGDFLLANRLAGLLRPGARLIIVSSAGHRQPTSIWTTQILIRRSTIPMRPIGGPRRRSYASPRRSTVGTRMT